MLRNELLIYFPSKEFYSGENFDGYAELRLPFPLKTSGVKLEVVGREVSEFNGRRDVNVFLNVQQPLKGPGSDGKSSGGGGGILGGLLGKGSQVTTVPAGVHQYPFQVSLPDNLPPSYQSPYANIEYEVKVTVLAGEKSMSDLVSAARLPVGGSLFDFNFLGNKSTPVQIKEQKTFLMTKGTFDVTLALDSQVFLSGDTIKARFSLFNSSGKKINDVTVKLMQKIEVFLGGKSIKEEEYVLASVSLGSVDAKQQKHPVAELPIPTTAPESVFVKPGSNIKVGKNLLISYEIFVQGDATLASSFKLNAPIFVVRRARHTQLVNMANGVAPGAATAAAAPAMSAMPPAGAVPTATIPTASPMSPQQPAYGMPPAGTQYVTYGVPPQGMPQTQPQMQYQMPPQQQQQQQQQPQMQYGQPQYAAPAAAPAAAASPAAAPAVPQQAQPQFQSQPQMQQTMYPSLATEGTTFDYSYRTDVRQLPPPPVKKSSAQPGQGGSAPYEEFYQQ